VEGGEGIFRSRLNILIFLLSLCGLTYQFRGESGEPVRQATYDVINLANGRVSAAGETIFGLSGKGDEGNMQD